MVPDIEMLRMLAGKNHSQGKLTDSQIAERFGVSEQFVPCLRTMAILLLNLSGGLEKGGIDFAYLKKEFSSIYKGAIPKQEDSDINFEMLKEEFPDLYHEKNNPL